MKHKTQDPKFYIENNRLVGQSGPIPDDEPIFILRGRDVAAIATLCDYQNRAAASGAAGIWPYLTFWRPTSVLNEDATPAKPEPKGEEARQFHCHSCGTVTLHFDGKCTKCLERKLEEVWTQMKASARHQELNSLREENASLRAQLAEAEKKRAEAEEEARRLINRTVENFVWLRDDSELVEAAQDYCAKHNTTSTMVGLVMLREKATTLLVERDQLRARVEIAEWERDEVLKAHSSECRAHGTTIAKLDRLQAELVQCREALAAIHGFPVHSEPHGAALTMQDIAKAALEGGK